MSSKTHKKQLTRIQEKREKERLENELKTIIKTEQNLDKNIDDRDITSLRYKLAPMLEIAKSDTMSDYYKELIQIYQRDNYTFKFKSFAHFAFNPFALLFGPLYFAFSRLYMGLFINIMLMTIIAPMILSIPNTLPIIVFLVGNILCCLTANFYIVHKAVHELDKSIKNKNNLSEYSILRTVYKKSTQYRVFHLFFGIIYTALVLYGILIITNTNFDEGLFSGFNNVDKQINYQIDMNKIKTLQQKN